MCVIKIAHAEFRTKCRFSRVPYDTDKQENFTELSFGRLVRINQFKSTRGKIVHPQSLRKSDIQHFHYYY